MRVRGAVTAAAALSCPNSGLALGSVSNVLRLHLARQSAVRHQGFGDTTPAAVFTICCNTKLFFAFTARNCAEYNCSTVAQGGNVFSPVPPRFPVHTPRHALAAPSRMGRPLNVLTSRAQRLCESVLPLSFLTAADGRRRAAPYRSLSSELVEPQAHLHSPHS